MRKIFLRCWQASEDRSSRTKKPFTPKCLWLKRLAKTRRLSQGETKMRTMGLSRERVGSSGLGFWKLPMQNISLTGVGQPVSRIPHILYRDPSIGQRLGPNTTIVPY